MDVAAQKKLTTLQTLKEILDNGGASPKDLVDIRRSIDQQLVKKREAAIAASLQPPAPAALPALPAGLNTTNLAELLRATASQNTTPQPYQYNTPPVTHATPAQPALSLIDRLKSAGLMPPAPTPPQGMTPPAFTLPMEITFTSASVKIHRPQMVSAFLTAKPNQCSTCGRRFTSDEGGKEKKARHLDWHFKTKARMIEAEKRGQNRSWYVDEREWMSSREYDDDAEEGNPAVVTAVKKEVDFVRADPILGSQPCPIDQEKFKQEWSEEVQDWIFRDAMLVGGRLYHASCFREVSGNRDAGNATPLGAGIRGGTPDSVLGKRKADSIDEARSRLKFE